MKYFSIFFVFFVCSFFLRNDVDKYLTNTMILLVILFVCLLFVTLKQVKKRYQTNKMFHEQINYTLNNKSIRFKNETIDSTVLWTRYYKIKEAKNFFLLYPDKTVMELLPKKAFKAEELESFRKFAKSLNLEVEVFEK